jgi:hypothetical protein
MGIVQERPSWRPKVIESADLAAGLRAARELQGLPIPPMLAKQVAGYIMRAGTELASRDIDPARLLGDNS